MKTQCTMKQAYKLYHSMYAVELETHGPHTPIAAMIRNKISRMAELLDETGASYLEAV